MEPGLVGEYPDLSTVNSQPLPSPFTGSFLQASWGAPGHPHNSAQHPPPAPLPLSTFTMVAPTPPPQQYTAVCDSPGPSQQGVWPHAVKACGILHKKGYRLRSVLATHSYSEVD